MDDCLIIGGGVIGLSLAYELARQDLKVHVVERQAPGREASWAGAGILPAGVMRTDDSPYQQLSGLSCSLHPQWAQQLMEETGIDNGYRPCGGLFMLRKGETCELLGEDITELQRRGVRVEELSPSEVREFEAGLAVESVGSTTTLRIPETAQLRNPRHLKALIAACQQRGVRVTSNAEFAELEVEGGTIRQVRTAVGDFAADKFCVAAGAWSRQLLAPLQVQLAVKPMRGQMVLLKLATSPLRSIVHSGSHYLVPRDDGHVLVGSTVEDVGFDKRTTSRAVDELLQFATSLVPALGDAAVENCWAGLRPGSPQGVPTIGRLPGVDNAYVATGHFRWGLYLAPATAVVLSELILGRTTSVDLAAFQPRCEKG